MLQSELAFSSLLEIAILLIKPLGFLSLMLQSVLTLISLLGMSILNIEPLGFLSLLVSSSEWVIARECLHLSQMGIFLAISGVIFRAFGGRVAFFST
jgi:hypothetical protein